MRARLTRLGEAIGSSVAELLRQPAWLVDELLTVHETLNEVKDDGDSEH